MAADSLADTMLRHSTYLDRLASGIINKSVDPAIVSTAEQVRAILADYSPDMPRAEFTSLRNRIQSINNLQLRAMFATITEDLGELALNEADYLVKTLQEFADAGMDVSIPTNLDNQINTEMVLISGDQRRVGLWAEYVSGNIAYESQLIDNAIRSGYSESLTKRDLVKRVVGTKAIDYRDGLYVNRVKRQVESLVRTGVSHYAAAAQEAVTDANTDIIEGEVFLNVFDNRTTLTCLHYGQLAAEGKVYKPNDPDKPRLPLHYNERSRMIWKIIGLDPFDGRRAAVGGKKGKDAREAFEAREERLNERRRLAAEDRAEGLAAPEVKSKVTRFGRGDDEIFKPGTISADTSPAEFLRQQPRWFVESTLGKQRTRLFLDGKLPIEKFTDMRGSPLTLEQLRALDGADAAFRRAGLD